MGHNCVVLSIKKSNPSCPDEAPMLRKTEGAMRAARERADILFSGVSAT